MRRVAAFAGPADMIEIKKSDVAVIFVSRRGLNDPEGYARAAAEMVAEVINAPGYLAHDSVSSPDGQGITISYWKDEESVASWRAHARHTEIRGEGRERWYDWYRLVVANVSRAYDWHR
jgi:heme-degrading monooxygenase HmoA